MAEFLSVALVDLTCRSPAYDARLGEELVRVGASVDYWVAGCLAEQEKQLSGRNPRPAWDLAGRLPLAFPRFRKAAKAGEYVLNMIRLLGVVRRGGHDVVHLQWLPLSELAPRVARREIRALRKAGASVVLTVHNVAPHDSPVGLEGVASLYREADALICHTRSARHRLTEDLGMGRDRVRVIPHGPLELGDRTLRSSAAEKRDRTVDVDDGPTALLFGFMRPYKGVELALEAWPRVLEEVPDAVLQLAGSGKPAYLQEIRQRIEELGLGSAVETDFRFLPEDELSGRIAAANVLVYPYREITQSGALLTGLDARKAVVASRLEGFEEVVRHRETGLLVPPGDPEALGSAVAHLLANPREQQRLGEAAAMEVRSRFSWSRIALKTLALYADLTGREPAQREGLSRV